MSYKAEVIADSSGKWAGNGLAFSTHAEAESYVKDLFSRWISVRTTRVIESDAPVNYAWLAGKAVHIADAIDHHND